MTGTCEVNKGMFQMVQYIMVNVYKVRTAQCNSCQVLTLIPAVRGSMLTLNWIQASKHKQQSTTNE